MFSKAPLTVDSIIADITAKVLTLTELQTIKAKEAVELAQKSEAAAAEAKRAGAVADKLSALVN
jgi:hypothetical protein